VVKSDGAAEPDEHPARVVAQREDVARADEVAGGGAGVACEGGTMISDIIFLTPFFHMENDSPCDDSSCNTDFDKRL
jgi:hypothetical protein